MEKIQKLSRELAELCEKGGIGILCVFGNASSKMGYEAYLPDKAHALILKANTTLMNNSRQARRSLEIQA